MIFILYILYIILIIIKFNNNINIILNEIISFQNMYIKNKI